MPKYPKPLKGWCTRDVEWHSIKKSQSARRGKILACSTKATSDLIITVLEDEMPWATIRELKELITYDEEAKKVLQAYIDAGQGDEYAIAHFG